MRRALALFASPLQLLAVLAFFLPFYSVSCQGRPLATASGYEVATGGFDVDEQAERWLRRSAGGEDPGRGAAAWLLLFPVLAAAAGVAAGLGARSPEAPSAASARVTSAVLGALGVAVAVAHSVSLRGDLRRAVARGITLDLEPGWYVAVGTLLAGTVLSAVAHVVSDGAPRSEADPPPSLTPSP